MAADRAALEAASPYPPRTVRLRTLAIRISVLDDGRLWAAASGDGGQEDDALRVPEDEAFAALLSGLARLQADGAAIEALGRQLFDALFPDSIRRVYDGSVGQLAPDARLRLLLTFPREASAFAGLPWEYLHDPARGPLAQRGVSIVRAIAQAAPPRPMAVTPPLRVLLTAAQTEPPVDVRRELIAAEDALRRLGDQVVVTLEPRLTMEKLREHLREGYHVWHFVGHGGDGQLLLEDTYGDADPVEASVLAGTLADSGVRLAVISACRGAAVTQDVLGSVAPGLVAAGVPAAVAMQFAVAEESTRAFTAEFYQALGRGWPIDACVAEGRKALLDLASGSGPDWGIPVVYTCAEDGVLFSMPDAERDPLAAAQVRLAAVPDGRLPDAAPLPAGSRMRLGRNPLLVGRDQDLLRVAAALLDEGVGTPTVAVTGMAGVGKTSLATELAHRYGQYFAGGVFWVRCADPGAIAAEVAACGGPEGLGLPGWAELKTDAQAALVRAAWEEPVPRLLIFDGCEDVDVLAAWRPASGGCRVVLTSLRSSWGAALAVRPAPLEVLARPASVALLRKHRPELAEDDPALASLAEELGDLPLALRLAGSYLETYRDDARLGAPATLLAELRATGLLAHEALAAQDLGDELSVGRTFALSLSQLDRADPADSAAHALLARAAWFAPGAPIPRELLLSTIRRGEGEPGSIVEQAGKLLKGLSSLWGAPQAPAPDPDRTAARALARLVALGLLEQESGGAHSIHRLVAAFARQAAHDPGAQGDVELALFKVLAEQYSAAGYFQPVGDLLPHLLHITDQALVREDNVGANRANSIGLYFHETGAYQAGRRYFERALAIHEQLHGPVHAHTAAILGNLGQLLRDQGDFAAARQYLERTLAVQEQLVGAEHPDTAIALNNLGQVLRDQGDLAGARACYERALAICERAPAGDQATAAAALSNLALVLQNLGEVAAARQHYERALAIQEQTLGPQHPYIARTLNNIGMLLQNLGEVAAARQHYERALAIQEQALGPQHPHLAIMLNNLGYVLKEQGELAAARQHYERALAIQEQALGPQHPHLAIGLNNLGTLNQAQGKLAEARQHYERALAIQEQALGPQHPDVAAPLGNLGLLLKEQGDLAGARQHLERALAIEERAHGLEHFEVMPTLRLLGSLSAQQGDLAAARAYFERVVAICEKELGPTDPVTIDALSSLALVLQRLGEAPKKAGRARKKGAARKTQSAGESS